jgi:hypothetical protein
MSAGSVAEVFPGLTGQRLDGFPVGDVALSRNGLNAGTGQLRGGLAGRGRVDIGDHDMRARRGQRDGDAPADAAAPSGHHGDLVSKLFHEFLPLPWTPKSSSG